MRATDLLVIGWCFFLAVVCLAFVPASAGPWLSALPYGVVAASVLVLALNYERLPGPLRLLRRTYPLFLMPQAFLDICRLSGLLHGGQMRDSLVRTWDPLLFGVEPAWWLYETLPWPWLNEVMHAFYFSYFVIIVGTGLALELADHAALRRFLWRLTVVWVSTGLIYLSYPVAGPHALRGRDYDQPTPFVWVMNYIYASTEHSGGALPSSHVAVAWTCWASVYAWRKSAHWYALPFALGVTVSTVYCRYHYLVDVVGGLALASLMVPLADRLLERLDPAALTQDPQGLRLADRWGWVAAVRRIVSPRE